MVVFNIDPANFTFDPAPPKAEWERLVVEYHYSGYVPSSVQYVAGLRCNGRLVAAIVFTIPATRWREQVYELARLVRTPEFQPPLTRLISKAMKELKKIKNADLVVSFADSTHAHHGGVYQAASWRFHTTRKAACDAFIIDGVLTPRRTCNHRYGTGSVEKLPSILRAKGSTCVPHYDTGKSLYWFPLTYVGLCKAERLKLESRPYEKPEDLS